MTDEFDERAISFGDEGDGRVALHSAVTDEFVVVGSHGSTLTKQVWTREEAERLAVWLRCRLDKSREGLS